MRVKKARYVNDLKHFKGKSDVVVRCSKRCCRPCLDRWPACMSRLQNLGDDEGPFPGSGKFVAPSGVLSQPKYQVSHLEVSEPNPSGVVASQGLLIPRRV
jgi:hypothetical protein